ncbi:MAG: hypothetical protein EA398_11545, partial [Deltaproteobacteria bacterium]
MLGWADRGERQLASVFAVERSDISVPAPSGSIRQERGPVQSVQCFAHHRVAGPVLGDAFIDLWVAKLLDRSLGGRWILAEAPHDPVVPQRHPHDGRQLLTGEMIADDPIEAGLPILLGEAVLLCGSTEVHRNGIGCRPCIGRHVDGEEL